MLGPTIPSGSEFGSHVSHANPASYNLQTQTCHNKTVADSGHQALNLVQSLRLEAPRLSPKVFPSKVCVGIYGVFPPHELSNAKLRLFLTKCLSGVGY